MEAIPVVDLRLLTQAEINALSRASSSSASGDSRRRCDDVVIPKIDRSVFNESAGSRKQTYSRLRLAPRKPPDFSPSPFPSSSSAPAARGRGRRPSGLPQATPPSAAPPLPPLPPSDNVDDPGRRENEQIILFLRQLFTRNGVQIADAATAAAAAHGESAAVPSAGVRANVAAAAAAAHGESAAVPSAGVSANHNPNPNPVGTALGKRGREQEAAGPVSGKDGEALNVNGVAVDLVGLEAAADPFGPELRRMTQGLVTEEEFLRFLSGLDGQWGSRRKRRRIVDAAMFGDALPKGWKLLLALKRKEGNIWLHCRRYISPSGKQFISCKEVSSYLLSFVGSHKIRQQNAAQNSADKLGNGPAVGYSHEVNITGRSPGCISAMPISTFSMDSGKQIVLPEVENPAKVQFQVVLNCQECDLTFADKGAHVQHLLTFHRPSRKKRRVGQSIVDGVIIRDGKYECQFCHKMFTERRRYNGHVGIHVKYYDRSLQPMPDDMITDKNVISSSDKATSAFAEGSNLVGCEKETKLVDENMSTQSIDVINGSYPHGNEHVGNTVVDDTLKSSDNEKEKIMVNEICNNKAIDEIKNSFPLKNSCDNDKERNVMQEICPLPNNDTNDSSPGNNMLIEGRKNDHITKVFDNSSSSIQEVHGAICIDEISADFPLSNKVDKVDCFPDCNNETSKSGFVEIGYGMTDDKPREAAETENVMNDDMNTRPSLTNVGNCTSEGSSRNDLSNRILLDERERSSELNIGYESNSISMLQGGQTFAVVTSSGSVIDGIKNCENKICLDSNGNVISGSEQTNTGNTVAIFMGEELVEMVKSGNEPENDLECTNTSSDRDVMMGNTVHDETQLSETEERFLENSVMVPSGRKYCDIDIAIHDMLPSNGEEIMFEIMGQSSNEMKGNLLSDDTVLDAAAPRHDTGIADEGNMQSLRINLQATWEQNSAHFPILDMISDQDDGHLHCLNGNHEAISCFDGMRLDDIEPQKCVFSTGRDSRHRPDQLHSAGLVNGPDPCVQLEWASAFSNLGPGRRRFTTVCVWCSTEFEHDDVDVELQPDSVGFMCPTCKAKISGQNLV